MIDTAKLNTEELGNIIVDVQNETGFWFDVDDMVAIMQHTVRKADLNGKDEEYAENGKVTAVTFALDCCGSLHGFRLEARPDGVKAVMAKERTKCDDEQAERIAWRNLKDWIAAQVALVETEQATMDELFFPKLIDRNEKTLYEVFQTGQLMLGDGG